ncbi:MAG TPA: PemK family transcriptional regulator [Chloroflexi bacterium]|nr:PemK family transcriptional regulator [Chloroflexota bacterium]
MARGDVVYVDFPAPPGGAGHEQAGRRPAIAVQTDSVPTALPTVVLVPLTTKLAALRYPFTIRVAPSPQNGLTHPSVLLVFQLRVTDQRRILRTVGRLERQYLAQLDAELRRLLDL